MRTLLTTVLFVLSFAAQQPSLAAAAVHTVPVTSAAPFTASLQVFATEIAAQKHCPRDEVVWLNTRSGIYHEKGMRWYGTTREGAYVCRQEADASGDRDTRNGQ